eukprot:6188008-Pleurochrysis_carterae.AAC.3
MKEFLISSKLRRHMLGSVWAAGASAAPVRVLDSFHHPDWSATTPSLPLLRACFFRSRSVHPRSAAFSSPPHSERASAVRRLEWRTARKTEAR